MKKHASALFSLVIIAVLGLGISCQPMENSRPTVHFKPSTDQVEVWIDSLLFTTLRFEKARYKPVLHPVYDADNRPVTRRFPFERIPGERYDHPHHIGVWLNHGDVNGLDFWNNSDSIRAEKKEGYGHIEMQGTPSVEAGIIGKLSYQAAWKNHKGETLIQEQSHYRFTEEESVRIIDRHTTLQAETDILFEDSKEGFFAIRVRRELEQSYEAPQGKVIGPNQEWLAEKNDFGKELTSGLYHSSEGIEGDDAWGTRARWMRLSGMIEGKASSVVIIDYPENINYPSHWMARGYGLFAINPLGSRVYSEGKEALDYRLPKGEAITFRYRMLVAADTLSDDWIDQEAQRFYYAYYKP